MKYLHDAGKKAGLTIITEVVDEYSLNCALEYVEFGSMYYRCPWLQPQ